jgi:O-acetyl-ADP-ribose deacetylase (regulator of RNase III)
MLFYTTGDLLKSDAEALVNTVNCEGYMGKGIAYQFKLQFPDNNTDYINACKSGSLKTGRLHFYKEQGKIIINFPTKDKWREKSRMEYITSGLDQLAPLIKDLHINSIAIPPLGSGNGGLIWTDVRNVIEKKLINISQSVNIYIYEPSKGYSSLPVNEPKLSSSALVLMEIKIRLKKFNKFRLQKAAYFVNVISHKGYFNFEKHKFGPYDHSIDIVSKKIREFQTFYGTKSTEEAKKILYNKLISESVKSKLTELSEPIEKACNYVNSIDNDHDLECLSTICFLIEKNTCLREESVIQSFKSWSDDKAKRFSEIEISAGLKKLYNSGIIEQNLIGYTISV